VCLFGLQVIPIHEEFSKLFTYYVIGKSFKLRDQKHHTKYFPPYPLLTMRRGVC
jgi:hypothetical protein